MGEIGVRELKTRASEVVRMVREHSARYTVTHRGRAVALLLPVEDVGSEGLTALDALDELNVLGAEISESWISPKSSAELLSEMRR